MSDNEGLYHQQFEHDSCGIGAVVNIKGVQTHEIVDRALKIVENLEHRAGRDAEGKTGDGVGILLQISHKFFKKAAAALGIGLGAPREYGVGMLFFPRDEARREAAQGLMEEAVREEGMEFLGLEDGSGPPGDTRLQAAANMPKIMQCFVKKPEGVAKGLDFDRKLYVARGYLKRGYRKTGRIHMSYRSQAAR
jgi:glutamate synthase (ferredoxin)